MLKSYISKLFEHIHLINYNKEIQKICDVIESVQPHELIR
jgi:hypothetical protein